MKTKLYIIIALSLSSININAAEKYYAEVVDGVVIRVIVGDYAKKLKTKGEWIETKKDDAILNYSSRGFTYDPVKKNFIFPKPKDNAILDEKCDWIIPVRVSTK